MKTVVGQQRCQASESQIFPRNGAATTFRRRIDKPL
jgi:hypothetical protein